MPTKPRAPTKETYLVFAGAIDQHAVQRFFVLVSQALQEGAGRLHVVMQSGGGSIGDGVCLNSFFAALPIPVTAYNIGTLSSSAVIAYLGASERKASATSAFLLHRVYATLKGATAEVLEARVHSLRIDDDRAERILRRHLRLPDEKWTVRWEADLWIPAADAVSCGLATGLGEFSIPPGATIQSVL